MTIHPMYLYKRLLAPMTCQSPKRKSSQLTTTNSKSQHPTHRCSDYHSVYTKAMLGKILLLVCLVTACCLAADPFDYCHDNQCQFLSTSFCCLNGDPPSCEDYWACMTCCEEAWNNGDLPWLLNHKSWNKEWDAHQFKYNDAYTIKNANEQSPN